MSKAFYAWEIAELRVWAKKVLAHEIPWPRKIEVSRLIRAYVHVTSQLEPHESKPTKKHLVALKTVLAAVEAPDHVALTESQLRELTLLLTDLVNIISIQLGLNVNKVKIPKLSKPLQPADSEVCLECQLPYKAHDGTETHTFRSQ